MQIDNNIEGLTPHVLEVMVSPDKMTAFIKVLSIHNQCPLIAEQVIEKLNSEGIVYGICKEEIETFCERGKYYLKLKAAIGTPPVQGEDGRVEFYFETTKNSKPKENENGTIDFKDLNLIHNVQKDELLCVIIPPKQGVDGTNVYGQEVSAKMGKEVNIKAGKNTYLSEDRLKLYAKTYGNVRYERGSILVDDVYLIDGDVGPETGNIKFEGTVSVTGNVLEGFDIEAKDDIIVKGRVEGCKLTSGRNIIVNDGINGMKKGLLKATGDVVCKFIETGNVICGGDFHSDVALNSTIEAGNSIIIKGQRSSLIGGDYTAGKTIVVKNVGSEKNIPVSLCINPNWEIEEQKAIEHRDQIKEEIKLLDKEIEELRRFDNISETISQKTVSIHRNLTKKEALMNQLEKLSELLENIHEQKASDDYHIVCSGKIYNGVKISIGTATYKVLDTLNHQSFYLNNGEIISIMAGPSEE